MGSYMEFNREDERAKSRAMILAIGTSNPQNILVQDEFPDQYFRVCGADNMPHLKHKLKLICENTMIKKRHIFLNEQLVEENPEVLDRETPSLDARFKLEVNEIPKLGAEAASKAIHEWGRPKSLITHVVFHSFSGFHVPGPDFQVIKTLGLEPNVKRVLMYHNGCHAGGSVLRIAKDLAENNSGARVLVICAETMFNGLHAPSDKHSLDQLIIHAIFGDGAAAVIVGADPDLSIEHPIYEMYTANQTIIPKSDDLLHGQLQENGFVLTLSKDVPVMISNNIEDCLVKCFDRIGVTDWNSLFWMVHPGGPTILNGIEVKLKLKEEKLKATWHVLSEFGNMSSPTVMFVMDEVRKRSRDEGKTTTGDGLEWGVLVGFGPGLTMETIVLRSFPINTTL